MTHLLYVRCVFRNHDEKLKAGNHSRSPSLYSKQLQPSKDEKKEHGGLISALRRSTETLSVLLDASQSYTWSVIRGIQTLGSALRRGIKDKTKHNQSHTDTNVLWK